MNYQAEMLVELHVRLRQVEESQVHLLSKVDTLAQELSTNKASTTTLVNAVNNLALQIREGLHAIESKREENQESNGKTVREEEGGGSILRQREQGNSEGSDEKEVEGKKEKITPLSYAAALDQTETCLANAMKQDWHPGGRPS